MTPIVEKPPTASQQTAPVFTGRARWAAALLVTSGAALQVAEFVLEDSPSATADRIAWWVEHPMAVGLSLAAGILAIPFLIGGFAGMVRLSRQHSRRIAAAAAALLTCAMVGLAAIHGVEFSANMLAQGGQTAAAQTILDMSDPSVPGAVLFVMFLGGALLGTAAINVAMWRSPYVPRLAVVLGVAFMVLDFALGMGITGHLALLGWPRAASDAEAGHALPTVTPAKTSTASIRRSASSGEDTLVSVLPRARLTPPGPRDRHHTLVPAGTVT